jgi:hypothetical protein
VADQHLVGAKRVSVGLLLRRQGRSVRERIQTFMDGWAAEAESCLLTCNVCPCASTAVRHWPPRSFGCDIVVTPTGGSFRLGTLGDELPEQSLSGNTWGDYHWCAR